MSIQQNFPAITPSLSLNFARSKKLDPRITFTRTSSATRINETGLVEVVPANSPRFDHSYDPVSGTVRSLGLLIEESRSNLITYSEDFRDFDTSITWENFGINIELNSTTSPDGKLNGTKLINTAGTASRRVNSPLLAVTSGVTYTHSIWLKAGEYTTATVFCNTTAVSPNFNNLSARINLVTGAISGTINTPITIAPYPNGWWRISSTFTTDENTSTTGLLSIVPNTDAGGVNSVVGDGTSGIYIWGAQLETGAFPTSYIPTTNSTVTRTADLARIEGKVFQDFFNPSEGTTVIQIQNYNISNTSTSLLSYSGTTVPNNSMNYFRQLDAQPVGQIIFNGTLPMNIGLGAVWTDSSLQKHAFFYQKDNSGIANRSLVSLDTSVDIPVVERMIIGSTVQTNNKFTLSQLTYYPRRLTNAQLINLTK
jgi:hypothetical protein